MRTAYLTLGILLGLLVASEVGIQQVHLAIQLNRQENHVSTLTGFAEGWTRGRDHSDARWRFIYGICAQERDRN